MIILSTHDVLQLVDVHLDQSQPSGKRDRTEICCKFETCSIFLSLLLRIEHSRVASRSIWSSHSQLAPEQIRSPQTNDFPLLTFTHGQFFRGPYKFGKSPGRNGYHNRIEICFSCTAQVRNLPTKCFSYIGTGHSRTEYGFVVSAS